MVDLDAIEADAKHRIEALKEQRSRLAVDSLGGDTEVLAELDGVEEELGRAAGEIERIGLARAELARRQLEAEEQQRAEAQERAYTEARRLQVERDRVVKEFDKAAQRLAKTVADYEEICQRQQVALIAAGVRADLRSGLRASGFRLWGAIKFYERHHRVTESICPAHVPPAHCRPAAQAEPKIVEPLTEDS
jgi:hypothetical protein